MPKLKGSLSKRYTYKDQVYQFLFTAKMKIGQVWIVCCVYKSYKDGRIYVRERGDFNEKFKPVVDKLIQNISTENLQTLLDERHK